MATVLFPRALCPDDPHLGHGGRFFCGRLRCAGSTAHATGVPLDVIGAQSQEVGSPRGCRRRQQPDVTLSCKRTSRARPMTWVGTTQAPGGHGMNAKCRIGTPILLPGQASDLPLLLSRVFEALRSDPLRAVTACVATPSPGGLLALEERTTRLTQIIGGHIVAGVVRVSWATSTPRRRWWTTPWVRLG